MIGTLFKAFMIVGSEWVLWILIALSVITLAMVLERFRALRNQERLGALLWKEKLNDIIASPNNVDLQAVAKDVAETYPCLEGSLVTMIARDQNSADREQIEMRVSSFLGRQKIDLEKNISFLGTVGSNAPFIGLFGTVLGIIRAFNDLGGKVESAGAQTISSGISEALVATAVGLMVAIPAVMFFNYFQRKIKTIISRSESLSRHLISLKNQK